MLPSVVPMLLLFAGINRKDTTARAGLTPTAMFIAGYLHSADEVFPTAPIRRVITCKSQH